MTSYHPLIYLLPQYLSKTSHQPLIDLPVLPPTFHQCLTDLPPASRLPPISLLSASHQSLIDLLPSSNQLHIDTPSSLHPPISPLHSILLTCVDSVMTTPLLNSLFFVAVMSSMLKPLEALSTSTVLKPCSTACKAVAPAT